MAKRKRQHPFLLSPAADIPALQRFITLTNTDDYWHASLMEGRGKIGGPYGEIKKELRTLIAKWRKSGPNVRRLLEAEFALDNYARSTSFMLAETEGRTAVVAKLTPPEYSYDASVRDTAHGLFVEFLLNPANEKLAGPCAECDKFYLLGKGTNTVYCSKRCSSKYTSRESNEKKRKKNREAKLKDARAAGQEWFKSSRRTEYGDWMKSRGFSKNWTTRMINSKELEDPRNSKRLGQSRTRISLRG